MKKIISLIFSLFFLLVGVKDVNAFFVTYYNISAGTCSNPAYITNVPALTLSNSLILVDANQWAGLQSSQYMIIGNPSTINTMTSASIVDTCPLADGTLYTQPSMEYSAEFISPTSKKTVNVNDIINGSQYVNASNKSDTVSIMASGIPGLYFTMMFAGTNKNAGFIPVRFDTTTNTTLQHDLQSIWLIDKTFKGVAPGRFINLGRGGSSAVLRVKDALQPSTAPENYYREFRIGYGAMSMSGIAIQPSCAYTLSDNGIVDFGHVALSTVTAERETTVKKTLNLNLQCTGVDKFRTYITNTSRLLENGLLLANSYTEGGNNGAENIAIGLSVSTSSSENSGSVIYMDGSHAMEWVMGGGYSFDPVTRSIPLDVFLLSSGGVPTSGNYKATATIMLDIV